MTISVAMMLWLLLVAAAAVTVTASTRSDARTNLKKSPLDLFRLFRKTVEDSRNHLVAAGVARSVSILGMYPVDTIKVGQARPFRLSGIYGGVGGSLVGQVPYGVLTFGSYEIYKKALLRRFPGLKPVLVYAISAIFGDLTGSGWLCPSEVVKQQLQAGVYETTGDAVASIWKTKGLQGFYEGFWGGVVRDIPFRIAQLTSYEVTKNIFLGLKKAHGTGETSQASRHELSPYESAICGAISGTFSAAVTAPLDRIKTLLMTDSAAYGGNVLTCATHIWQEEGLAGFVTGLFPRVVYIAPSVVLFFIAYEATQQKLRNWSR